MKKKYPIVIVVISVLVILASIVGYTYSYFSAQVKENSKTQTVIKAGELNLEFTGGQEIDAEGIEPGWKGTKTFTVENTSNKALSYNIYIENITNGFNDDLVYTLKKGEKVIFNKKVVPKTKEGKTYIKTNIEIEASKTDSYTLEIEFKYTDEDQSINQGKEFGGTVGIDTIEVKNTIAFSEYLISLSSVGSELIQDSHEPTTQTGENATTDYRYIGATPKNYVCLEKDGKCDDNELYRIIGVIPTQKEVGGAFEYRVKLIKSTNYVGETAEEAKTTDVQGGYGYRWSGSNSNISNDWTASTLNTEILNGTETEDSYWNSISSYHEYIDNTVWYLGTSLETSPQDYYNNERGTNRGSAASPNIVNTTAKIGLMYPSDYGYATSGGNDDKRIECFSLEMSNSSNWGSNSDGVCRGNDWLYLYNFNNIFGTSRSMWTISSASTQSGVHISGSVTGQSSVANNVRNIFPVFNLASNVRYAGGTGDYNDPFTISISK